MKLTYYGTSAGGGIPEIFCSCRICENARVNRGKDIRTRSQAVLDDCLSIDYSVDTFLHSAYGGLDMRKIKHILITHAHHDHFLEDDVISRPEGAVDVHFYASEKSGKKLKNAIDAREAAYAEGRSKRTCDFRPQMHFIDFYQPLQILDYTVTPIRANHAPNVDAMIFIISGRGKSILWAHDTGLLLPEAVEFIKNSGIVFDLVSLDCTLERGNPITKSHMDIDRCKQTYDLLLANGNVTDSTTVIVSHIGHLVKRTHAELEAEAADLGMLVAYDGMTVIF